VPEEFFSPAPFFVGEGLFKPHGCLDKTFIFLYNQLNFLFRVLDARRDRDGCYRQLPGWEMEADEKGDGFGLGFSTRKGGEMTEEIKEESLGQYLRTEREKKNISLETIAKATRITLKNLQALENDEFQGFPAPVFVRGFLRTYANYIGQDPQKIISLFEKQTTALFSPPDLKEEVPAKNSRPLYRYGIALIILIIIGIAVFAFFPQKTLPPTSETVLPPFPNARTVEPPPIPPLGKDPFLASGKIPSGSEGEEKKKEGRQVLKVKAIEKTWMYIQPDDQPGFDVLLQPIETVTWTAQNQLKITVGNAGGVEMSFNGIPQGRLGQSGQVVHLLFPRDTKNLSEEKKE
jgi:cytoskeletal protein RodZ